MANLETKPMKVKVLKVGTIRNFGTDGKALSFALEVNGQQQAGECIRPKLFDHIKEGAELDADVGVRKWESQQDGLTHETYQIAEIRIGGQPVAGKGFGGPRGKSPEERQEIIRMAALKASVELVCTGKLESGQLLPAAEKFAAWILNQAKKSAADAALEKAGLD